MRFVTWLRALAPRPASPRPRRARLSLEPLEERAVPSAAHDVLYVGDTADNTVKAFDAATGAPLGTLVAPGASGLAGPRGMIFRNPGQLLVVNQNVGLPIPGEVLRYNGRTGDPLGAVVPHDDPHAPFAPRGMVLRDHVLYVANLSDGDTTPAGVTPDGEIDKYDATTGTFLGAFGRPAGWAGQFNPRGVVFGPDGNLYASVFDTSDLTLGSVLKIDVGTGTETVFASEGGAAPDLHRPEGLAFGPDGQLYVTGFRKGPSDNDKVVVLDPTTGAEEKSIALDAVGQPRAYGQAILFGPGGRLFVPISTPTGPYSGAVRSYDVSDGSFVNFEAPGTLGSPWYLTFGQTDPATLAYGTPDLSPELVNALLSLHKEQDQGLAP
jgi:DNA-binding beta-propeller fold protein YncE